MKVVFRTFLLVVVYVGWALIGTHSVLKNNIMSFHGPTIGGRFGPKLDCVRAAEALFIALDAAPFLYHDTDFGIIKAATTISKDDCLRIPTRTIDPDLLAAVQQKYEHATQQMKPGKPSQVLYMVFSYRRVFSAYPSWPLGKLQSLLMNFNDLSTGQGFIHYLRCDYSLHLEPYHTFILSNLHNQSAGRDVLERLSECGEQETFDALIEDRLSDLRTLSRAGQE